MPAVKSGRALESVDLEGLDTPFSHSGTPKGDLIINMRTEKKKIDPIEKRMFHWVVKLTSTQYPFLHALPRISVKFNGK